MMGLLLDLVMFELYLLICLDSLANRLHELNLCPLRQTMNEQWLVTERVCDIEVLRDLCKDTVPPALYDSHHDLAIQKNEQLGNSFKWDPRIFAPFCAQDVAPKTTALALLVSRSSWPPVDCSTLLSSVRSDRGRRPSSLCLAQYSSLGKTLTSKTKDSTKNSSLAEEHVRDWPHVVDCIFFKISVGIHAISYIEVEWALSGLFILLRCKKLDLALQRRVSSLYITSLKLVMQLWKTFAK